ncbi:MAG: hypothetical protein CME64_14880 [Halobacteriovoraceae bacterium]|nr:hypothetical protein [Halobacteriovoraceae bacterium]|tara:strand:+ start:22577 stop:23002 length:426 start_codon:yes stop_codon:yes gene_type:complete
MFELFLGFLILILGLVSFGAKSLRLALGADLCISFLMLILLSTHLPASTSLIIFTILVLFNFCYFTSKKKSIPIARVESKNKPIKIANWTVATILLSILSYFVFSSNDLNVSWNIVQKDQYNILLSIFILVMFFRGGQKWN